MLIKPRLNTVATGNHAVGSNAQQANARLALGQLRPKTSKTSARNTVCQTANERPASSAR